MLRLGQITVGRHRQAEQLGSDGEGRGAFGGLQAGAGYETGVRQDPCAQPRLWAVL